MERSTHNPVHLVAQCYLQCVEHWVERFTQSDIPEITTKQIDIFIVCVKTIGIDTFCRQDVAQKLKKLLRILIFHGILVLQSLVNPLPANKLVMIQG